MEEQNYDQMPTGMGPAGGMGPGGPPHGGDIPPPPLGDREQQPGYEVTVCSTHNKERTKPNMIPDGTGGWKCKNGNECKVGSGRRNNRGPDRNWEGRRGDFQGNQGGQWDAPNNSQWGGSRGGFRGDQRGGSRGNWGGDQRGGSRGNWGGDQRGDQRGGNQQGMNKRNGCAVRANPSPSLSFQSNTILSVDFEFVHGVPPGLKSQLARGETFPYPVAGTVMFWNKGDEVMLFQGRIAVPHGVEVVDDTNAREKAGLNAPWTGVALDTIQKLLSAHAYSASATPLDGMVIVGHCAQYYIQSLGIEWPSSLVCDITEIYQAENPDEPANLPVKIEDAYSQDINGRLPGDPLDPVVRCKMGLELFLFLKENFFQEGSKRRRSEAPTEGQPPVDSFSPAPPVPSQAPSTEADFSAPAPPPSEGGPKAPAPQVPQSWGSDPAPNNTWGTGGGSNWGNQGAAPARAQSRW